MGVFVYRTVFILVTGFLLTSCDYLPEKVAKLIDTTCPKFNRAGLEKFTVWKSVFFAFCVILVTGYGCYSLLRDVFGPVG